MASVSGPLRLSDPKSKKKKKKIDIPYYYWPNRLRRGVKNAIIIFVVLAVLTTIVLFATADDVSLNMTLGILGGIAQILMYVLTAMFGIVVQFGLLFWFLSRPKVEIIRPGDDTTVTFDDYWGQPQLVRLVKQWMSLLRDRKDFEKMGGKYISGLLLYGPPGTGKTMLAKAIAGESGMAFISAAGTSFQGMFWGMDILMVLRYAATARQLARKYGACVAYIDEIDAIGMNRGGVRGGMGGGMGGMASGTGMGLGMFALSTLLSQMDGMNNPTRSEKIARRIYKFFGRTYNPKRNWHVMWMGSTNRPDVLDPALTRSGRLDTKIAVDPPDRASRRLVIEGYLTKIQHDDTIDVESIVADTNGLTPADISAAITKDAVRLAFFAGRKRVSQKDIDKAFLEQQAGMETPVEEMDEEQRRVLAYHEAGHAVAQYYVMPDQKIVRVTIVKLSTGSQGHMAPVDTVEQHVRPIMNYAYEIIVAMAGRGSEKVLTGEMFDSVGGDYPMVRMLMLRLVESGFFGPPLNITGPSYDQYREKALEKYWLTMEDATEKLLRSHWKEVTALAEELLVKSTLSGKEVVEIIEANQTPESLQGNIIPKTLAAIRAQALAEVRGGYPNARALGEPQQMPVATPAAARNGNGALGAQNGGDDEEIVVINGSSNGSAGRGAEPERADGNGNGSHAREPEVISRGAGNYEPEIVGRDDGGYQPQVINRDADKRRRDNPLPPEAH
jgi:cell division protease FtsH